MAIRTGHGKGAGQPRIEVLPADELPAGIVAPRVTITAYLQARRAAQSGSHPPELAAPKRAPPRHAHTSDVAREYGRKGGLARAEKAKALRVLADLGLRGEAPALLAPYIEDARQFATAEVERLAMTVGAGFCGASPASIVGSAALALAASKAAYAAGNAVLGSRLADSSRQGLLAAHELCAKEAKALSTAPGKLSDGLAAFFPQHAQHEDT